MSELQYDTPAQIAATTVETAEKKAKLDWRRQLVLAILAGAFIAFASEGSNMAAFNLLANPDTYGLGKVLAGAVFGTGLMFVILAGGELFTGNMLMVAGVMSKRVRVRSMLRNWLVVYVGNLLGSLLIAFFMVHSGLFDSGDGLLGGVTIKIAAHKTGLPFHSALILGVMCNWIVCLSVWMAYGAKDMAGKVLVIFFGIMLFITSGFEHSIANMYYIPAGILAKGNVDWVSASHLSQVALDGLNWQTFLWNNLLPVTVGNILGGAVFVGAAYWFVYLREKKQDAKNV